MSENGAWKRRHGVTIAAMNLDPRHLDPRHCYTALLARDARFDGRFFVGVTSTGVYCRPVCRVRTPRAANCRFFAHAAAAEQQGFRPCRRCRPELAPGHAAVDSSALLARCAAQLIDGGFLEQQTLAALALRLGISERHLRRIFLDTYSVTPVAYAQTRRLLLAKQLLTDTALPIADIAMAAGFGSTRRMQTLFQQRYRCAPGQWRSGRAAADQIELSLGYRPPYDWSTQLAFLGARAIAGVEAVDGASYRRSVRLCRGSDQYLGWIEVSHAPARHSLLLRISPSLTPVLSGVLQRLRQQFDLDSDPASISAALADLATPGLRLPGAFDGFEQAVRAVLGQQISVRAATTLARRIAQTLGTPVSTPFAELTHAFPTAAQLAATDPAQLQALGLTAARARTLCALAAHCASGALHLDPGADVERTLAQLMALPGIGHWTAHYIALRALAWPDAFPHTDLVLRRALGDNPHDVLTRADGWRPWRGYAAIALWRQSSEAQTKPEETP